MQSKVKPVVNLVLTAVMISLNVFIERFPSFQSLNNHYSLSIITVVFAAVYLGLPSTVCVAALGDIIGSILVPKGAYFPGFTLTNAIAALILWVFLHKKVNTVNTVLSVVINKVVCTLLLNSLWISLLYKGGIDAFPAYLVSRLPQAGIMTVIDIALILAVFYDKSPVRKALDKAIIRG